MGVHCTAGAEFFSLATGAEEEKNTATLVVSHVHLPELNRTNPVPDL